MHPPNYPPPHTTTITSIVGSKDPRIVLLREGSKLNSKKDCPFPGWSHKNKRWEAWKPKPRGWQDDGKQDSGFAPEFQIITGFFLFDSLQPGGERGRRMGRASRAFTAIRFHWETAGLQRRGEPPADLRAAARASPQGQGASRCPARQRQLLQRRFQERAVSPGRAPPSCFPHHPQGTVDYRSSLHLPVRRRRGTRWQGDEDPHPRPRPPLAPCILSEIFPGQSSQSLYPVLKVRVVDVTLFISQFPFLVCRFSLLTRTGQPPGLQISYFLPPLTLSTDPGMRWLLTFTGGNHLLIPLSPEGLVSWQPHSTVVEQLQLTCSRRLPQLGFLALSVGRSTLPSHCTHLSRLWSPCGQKLPLTHLGFPLPPFSRSS